MKCQLMLLVLVTIIGWSCGYKSGWDSPNYSINLKLVRMIEDSMDTQANPCSDFHLYACGKWSHPFENSNTVKVDYDVIMELTQYMDNTHMSNMPDFIKKAYQFYTSCTDTDKLNELHYLQWLEKKENITIALLTSPATEKDVADDGKFDWVRLLATLRRYDMNEDFIEEKVNQTNKDSPKMIINLNKPMKHGGLVGLGSHNIGELNEFTKLPSDKPTIAEVWKDLKQLETLLIKLNDIKDDVGEQLITVKELPLPWLGKYLSIVLQQEPLDPNMKVSIQNIPYMKALDELLKKYDDKFISRYLEVKFLWNLYGQISPYYNVACMQTTRRLFPMAMQWLYEHLHPELDQEKTKIQRMFRLLVKSINQTLRNAKGGTVPESALAKLENMQLKIGNYPTADTIHLLDNHYARFNFNKSDMYGNFLQVLKYNFENDHNARKLSNELGSFNSDWQMIYPYYFAPANTVILPATMLKPPFYHWGYEDIFKYGSIGAIMARYIYEGLLLESFSDSDKENVTELAGLSTSADFVFATYPMELNATPYTIKGGHMPMEKLYFLNAAQYHCEKSPKSKIHDKFARLPQFAKTFGCKLDDDITHSFLMKLFGI